MSNIEIINNEIIIELAQRGAPGAAGKFTYGRPASPTAPGVAGTALYDDEYIYICIATNTWRGTRIDTSPWAIFIENRIAANGMNRIAANNDNRITAGA